ncbi:hypothetical protein [Longimicrobium sp.]|jgi:hypothetical protein|uniref:hypothetical protein n=1 Tax=Longimicrobium sp. TaxID=2029185 RepID=UPI002EDA266C
MKRPILLRLAPTLAIALVLSCTTPTGMCGCPPSRSHVEIHGVVRTAAGAPVPGAVMRASFYREQCGQGFGEPADQDTYPAQTNAAGAYEGRFISFGGPKPVCLRVSATRGVGTSADSAITEGAVVQLRDEDDTPARVRVDVVFPGS